MKAEIQKQNRVKYAVAASLSMVIFVITYKYTLNQINGVDQVDLQEHLWQASCIYLDRLKELWIYRPYMLWHICVKACAKFLKMPIEEAGALVQAGFGVLNYLITFFAMDRILQRLRKREAGVAAAVAGSMLSFSMPMYLWWFNTYHYEGQYAINAFFSPTHQAVKPFGLLAFLMAVDLLLLYQGKKTIFFIGRMNQRLRFVLFGVTLFVSTFAKPTFMFMLLPAGVIYLCIDLVRALRKKDGSWKKVWGFMWRIGCASIPSVIYLLLSYAAFYLWGGTNEDSKVAVYPLFTVWRIFSPNLFKSWVFSMAFPIWMVIACPRYFWKSVEGRLAVIGYLVGTLEFAFLVETGSKLEYGSFAWEMTSGMLLVWVLAAAKLVELTYDTKQSTWRNFAVLVGWGLLTLHLFNGLYYINSYAYII